MPKTENCFKLENMKIYKMSAQKIPLRVGNVGSFGSEYDLTRIHVVDRWLREKTKQRYSFNNDNIDLNMGRDFLEETKTYDIVILHHIFNPMSQGKPREFDEGERGTLNRSRKHTAEAWVERLASTGAKYIFVFGGYTEVAAWWLGEIPGYRYESDYGYLSMDMATYVKI